jgi:hypothetical protein
MAAGFISEWWTASNRNGGRLHVGKPGRNKSESAAGTLNAMRAAFKAGVKPSARIVRQFGISQSDVRKALAQGKRREA